jgi:hypothetical protein
MSSVINVQKIEDYLLLILPFATIPFLTQLGFSTQTAILISVALGGLSKGLAGIRQNPSSIEDWLLLVGTVIGAVAASISSATGLPLVYGTIAVILGYFAKAIIGLVQSYKTDSLEDGMMVLGTVISGIGAALGVPRVVELGLILASVSKSVPGIVSGISHSQSQSPPSSSSVTVSQNK